jgi:hypothetical protein
MFMLFAKHEEAMWENCYENVPPLIIHVDNLTKSVNRKWKSDRPEIESTVGDHMSILYAKYQENVISSCWENC